MDAGPAEIVRRTATECNRATSERGPVRRSAGLDFLPYSGRWASGVAGSAEGGVLGPPPWHYIGK